MRGNCSFTFHAFAAPTGVRLKPVGKLITDPQRKTEVISFGQASYTCLSVCKPAAG